jgi:hypothetical protein
LLNGKRKYLSLKLWYLPKKSFSALKVAVLIVLIANSIIFATRVIVFACRVIVFAVCIVREFQVRASTGARIGAHMRQATISSLPTWPPTPPIGKVIGV